MGKLVVTITADHKERQDNTIRDAVREFQNNLYKMGFPDAVVTMDFVPEPPKIPVEETGEVEPIEAEADETPPVDHTPVFAPSDFTIDELRDELAAGEFTNEQVDEMIKVEQGDENRVGAIEALEKAKSATV